MNEHAEAGTRDDEERKGTGALCAEAQADGVPCTESGKDCEICGRAARPEPPPDTAADEHPGW